MGVCPVMAVFLISGFVLLWNEVFPYSLFQSMVLSSDSQSSRVIIQHYLQSIKDVQQKQNIRNLELARILRMNEETLNNMYV